MDNKHHAKESDLIIKNVKIDTTMFVETYTREELLQLLQECHNHNQEVKKDFICVYYKCKKN